MHAAAKGVPIVLMTGIEDEELGLRLIQDNAIWKPPSGKALLCHQDAAYVGWLEPPNASLAYAVCFVLVWFAILAILHRRGLVLKV